MLTHILDRNSKLYLTTKVSVVEPTDEEVAGYSFAESVKSSSPNDSILWLKGEYVQGDAPNKNGQMWTSEELSIKSLTPKLMPVTVMHDFNTAVGVIADTKLFDGENASHGARIETVLAIWAHRFPEAASEIAHNHEAGTLMQSMECDARQFECSECAQVFSKPVSADDLCSHIRNGEAARRLLNVNFTGTGLIFGSRGAQGANPNAFLEEVSAEVASWSDKRMSDPKKKRSKKMTIEIEQSKYDELTARPTQEQLEEVRKELSALADEKTKLEDAAEKLEIENKKVSDELAEANAKISEAAEAVAQDELAKERLAEVSKDLTNALTEKIKSRLAEQARVLSDEDWSDRIEELSELVDVDPASGEKAGEEFSEEAMHLFNNKGNANTVDFSDIGRQLDSALKPKG